MELKSEHLLSMRTALESEVLTPSPSLEQVELEIGPFTKQIGNKNKKVRVKKKASQSLVIASLNI